ncbi:MAG: hypothetical protein QGI86_21845 [Candidatus Poribacteria bacterium]|nr:hypothetical protein [Candidatus Poribacteria bacterium]MDP6748935.1 hypothetical protein [Candidatus Poribacteria bacterium]
MFYNEVNTITQLHVIVSDVFISYSRHDIDLVRHLSDQLTARNRGPWTDWQNIPEFLLDFRWNRSNQRIIL